MLSTDFCFSGAHEHELGGDSLDIDIVLSILSSCRNDPHFDIPESLATYDVNSDDVRFYHEDVLLCFLNGRCVNRTASGCSDSLLMPLNLPSESR